MHIIRVYTAYINIHSIHKYRFSNSYSLLQNSDHYFCIIKVPILNTFERKNYGWFWLELVNQNLTFILLHLEEIAVRMLLLMSNIFFQNQINQILCIWYRFPEPFPLLKDYNEVYSFHMFYIQSAEQFTSKTPLLISSPFWILILWSVNISKNTHFLLVYCGKIYLIRCITW